MLEKLKDSFYKKLETKTIYISKSKYSIQPAKVDWSKLEDLMLSRNYHYSTETILFTKHSSDIV